jgi:hypothetical protein
MVDVIRELGHLEKLAKEDKTRRFDRLYRLLRQEPFLVMAKQRIAKNKGANTPGVDGQVMDDITPDEIVRLGQELAAGTYQPQPVRRRYIPKRNGKLRPLGIPIPRSHCTSIQWALGFGHDWAAWAAQSVYHRLITLSNGVTSACAPVCAARR